MDLGAQSFFHPPLLKLMHKSAIKMCTTPLFHAPKHFTPER
jgi:hypothetical protein